MQLWISCIAPSLFSLERGDKYDLKIIFKMFYYDFSKRPNFLGFVVNMGVWLSFSIAFVGRVTLEAGSSPIGEDEDEEGGGNAPKIWIPTAFENKN